MAKQKTLIVDLTIQQEEELADLFEIVKETSDAGMPGMLIAQIQTCGKMEAGFVRYKEALRIQKILSGPVGPVRKMQPVKKEK